MKATKIDHIIHPVRLKIIQILAKEDLAIDEIAKQLRSVPQSSIYRHVNKLHQDKVIRVAKLVKIRGTQERIYQLKIQKLRSILKIFKKEFGDLFKI